MASPEFINYKKPDKVMIKVEDLEEYTNYAFTISPQVQFTGYDRKTHSQSYSYPHRSFRSYVLEHLSKCKYSDYDLHFECSPKGYQHYHGTLLVSDTVGFFTHDIHILNMLGSYCCKEIQEEDKWLEYISKQEHVWQGKYDLNTIQYRLTKEKIKKDAGLVG